MLEPVAAPTGQQRTVTVVGQGTARVAPDTAILQLGVETYGTTRELAWGDARARAEQYAALARATLGRVLRIDETAGESHGPRFQAAARYVADGARPGGPGGRDTAAGDRDLDARGRGSPGCPLGLRDGPVARWARENPAHEEPGAR